MRVLFINSVCGIRSTGRIVTDLAMDYIAQGHEVKIAYGRGDVPAQFQDMVYRIGTEWNVRVAALKARIFDNEGFNAIRETRKLTAWAQRYDPDVVWLHNLHGYYLNIEELFRWIKSRPQMQVLWTLHDCWAFTGHCAHFTMAGCTRWKTHCQNCCQTRVYPKSAVKDNCKENFIRKRAAFCGVKNMTLISPSRWLGDLVKQSFLKDYPVEVIHNQIDTSVFKPTAGNFRIRYGVENRKIVLGVSSVWNNAKGYADFLKLAGMLDDSYVIVMVGLTKQQMKSLPSPIIGIERTDTPAELAEIYTTADVFVNLTYEETFSMVNLEAQACGTPCLTYRTGGTVEIVPPENVVEQGDLDAMAARIRAVCAEG